MGRGGSNPPSDTNRTYTAQVRFYQHSSFARLEGKGQSQALVESSFLRRFSRLQDAHEICDALDHRADVVLGERRRRTAPTELLLGGRLLSLDLADPPGDDRRFRAGLERLPVAGESGITIDEHLSSDRCATVVDDGLLLSLGECPARFFQPVRLEDP